MVRLFTVGYENGDLDSEATVTAAAGVAVQSTVTRGGIYALKASGFTSGARGGAFYKWATANPGLTQYGRFYLYVSAYPSAENCLFTLCTAISILQYPLTLGSDGALRAYLEPGQTTNIGTSAVIPLNIWVRVEWSYLPGATDTLSYYLEGTQFATSTSGTQTSSLGFFVGCNGSLEAQTAGTWYFDDMATNDSSGTAQNGLPGPGDIVHLWPNAAGDFAEGTAGGTAPAATGWQSVNSVPPNDGTDFWSLTVASTSPTTAQRLDVALQDFTTSAQSVTLVQVGVRMMPASNAACNYISRIKSQASGTLVESAAVSVTGTAWVTNDDTIPRTAKLTQYVDPQAGGAWTAALLNTTQIGVRSTDVVPNPQFTALWLAVEYVPATPPLARPRTRPAPFRPGSPRAGAGAPPRMGGRFYGG